MLLRHCSRARPLQAQHSSHPPPLPSRQVVINNVHVRYEEPGGSCAFGLQVARVAARSADANWQPK